MQHNGSLVTECIEHKGSFVRECMENRALWSKNVWNIGLFCERMFKMIALFGHRMYGTQGSFVQECMECRALL